MLALYVLLIYSDFKVTANAPTYGPETEMSFKLEHREDFHLYVFNQDEHSGALSLIYPLDPILETWPGQSAQRFPQGVALHGELGKMERILFIAAARPLPINGKTVPKSITLAWLRQVLDRAGGRIETAVVDVFIVKGAR